jgi:hypothetical protein
MNFYTCLGDIDTSPCGTGGQDLEYKYQSMQSFKRYRLPKLLEFLEKENRRHYDRRYDKISVYTFTNVFQDSSYSLVAQYNIKEGNNA